MYQIHYPRGITGLFKIASMVTIQAYYPNSTGIIKNPPAGSTIEILGEQQTDCLKVPIVLPPFPDIFHFIPMEGQLQWSESFESHPTGSLKFRTLSIYEPTILASLRNGTHINFYGFHFRITGSPQITVIKASTQPIRAIEVSISLSGYHEIFIEEQVPLTLSPALNEGDCASGNPTGRRSEKLYLSDIARRAGGSYIGPDDVPIEVPKDVTRESSTSFSSELSARLRYLGSGCFVRYRGPAVEAVPWFSTPQHIIREEEIISDVQKSYNGVRIQEFDRTDFNPFYPHICDELLPPAPLEIPTPPLREENQSLILPAVHYYPKVELTGKFSEEAGVEKTEDLQGDGADQVKFAWRDATLKVETLISNGNANIMPSMGLVKDLSIQSTGSNYGSTRITQIWLGNKLIKEILEDFDFYGLTGRDIVNLSTGEVVGAEPIWGVKKKTTKNFFFDDKGRELGWIMTGYQWRTLKEESPDVLETASLDLTDEIDAAEFALYQWQQIPIYAVHGQVLEPLFRYYQEPDLNQGQPGSFLPPWNIQQVRLPDGTCRYVNAGEDFIEPYFMSKSATYYSSFTVAKNPQYDPTSGEIVGAFLTSGEESYEMTEVKIIESQTTRQSVFTDSLEKRSTPEEQDKFMTISSSANAQGADNFKTQLKQVNRQIADARPTAVEVREIAWKRQEPEPKNGNDKAGEDKKLEFRYFAETPYPPPSGIKRYPQLVGGSKNYAHAATLQKAQLGAYIELNIDDAQQSLSESFTVFGFHPEYRPGDRLRRLYNGEWANRRILSVSWQIDFRGLVQAFDGSIQVDAGAEAGTQLQLGIDRVTNPIYTQERKIENGVREPQELDRFFIRENITLGSLPEIKQQSRLVL